MVIEPVRLIRWVSVRTVSGAAPAPGPWVTVVLSTCIWAVGIFGCQPP